MANPYVVLAGALRLRAAPRNGAVLTVLPRGHALEKMGQERGQTVNWFEVSTSIHERDFTGYVHPDYVMPADPAPQSHSASNATSLDPTTAQLVALTPTARDWIVDGLATHFSAVTQGLFDTPRRLCHFLAQAAHETAGFRTLEEYGGPAYWSRYDGRADLGNTQPGDGVLFHGRGIFQLTGRANYQNLGTKLGLDLVNDPELAEEPEHSLQVACEYWKSRKLQHYADANDIEKVTRRINVGLNGFEDRKRYYRRAWSIWGTPGEAAGV